MEKEYEILSSIKKDANITQRELSERTGISLGNVNILLKKLIKKGMLKAERINSRTVSYVLTPSGFKAIVRRTYDFITNSYRSIKNIDSQIRDITLHFKEQGISYLALYGVKDEFYELILNAIKEAHLSYGYYADTEEIILTDASCSLVYTWDNDTTETLMAKDIRCVNLLELLQG